MKLHPLLTVEVIIDACERRIASLDNPGFYIICDLEHDACEPDARKYVCEACGEQSVYGAEELLIEFSGALS